MKRYTILLILISAALLVTGCFLQNPVDQIDGLLGEGEFLSEGEELGIMPDDIIADVPRSTSKSFNFETMLPVQLVVDAEFYTSSFEPLAAESRQVIVTLKNSDGILIYGGITDEAGQLDAEVRLPGASETMTLSLHAEGYESREVVIPDMVRYGKIDRVMGMAAVPNASRDIFGLTDDDGDGIPDVYDAYPEDENSAFAYLMPADGYLTVAYEDLFGRAGAGDADYNDFISHYSIEESSNAEGITKIKVNAEAAVKLAGYNHTFGIRINSFVPPADLKVNYIDDYGSSATYTTRIDTYPNPGETSLEIVLFEHTGKAAGKTADFTLDFVVENEINNPQDPAVLSRPPYNPFLYVLNTGHDVHLIDEEPLASSINPADTFRDVDGFPWALLVPPGADGWAHPAEGQRIEEPYPRFTRWRESGGELSPDWYLHDTPWVEDNNPPVASFPEGDYEVSGAGTTAVNGIYKESGTMNARPLYTQIGGSYKIFYASFSGHSFPPPPGNFWCIDTDESTASITDLEYWKYGTVALPPESGWYVGTGIAPAPVFTPITVFKGSTELYGTLNIEYIFTDPDGDMEGATSFRWLRYDSADSTDPGTLIPGAEGASYTTTSDDSGMYLRVEITPVDEHDAAGEAVLSESSGIIGS